MQRRRSRRRRDSGGKVPLYTRTRVRTVPGGGRVVVERGRSAIEVLARAFVSEEAEAVNRVNGQERQPKVESEKSQKSEEYSFFTVRFDFAPGEKRRNERDEEYEAVEGQNDQQHAAVVLNPLAQASGTVVENVLLERPNHDLGRRGRRFGLHDTSLTSFSAHCVHITKKKRFLMIIGAIMASTERLIFIINALVLFFFFQEAIFASLFTNSVTLLFSLFAADNFCCPSSRLSRVKKGSEKHTQSRTHSPLLTRSLN